MSDTPRTDDALHDSGDECNPSMTPHSGGDWVPATVARQLERELNAANERIAWLENAGARIQQQASFNRAFRAESKRTDL